MNDKWVNKLSGIAIETLEQLAYVFFNRADAAEDRFFPEYMSVSVSFLM